MTRADVLRYAIAYVLMRARKIVRGLKEGLTEDERYAIADHVVRQLKEHGDPWHLSSQQGARTINRFGRRPLAMSVITRFADSTQTSPEVREGPSGRAY